MGVFNVYGSCKPYIKYSNGDGWDSELLSSYWFGLDCNVLCNVWKCTYEEEIIMITWQNSQNRFYLVKIIGRIGVIFVPPTKRHVKIRS